MGVLFSRIGSDPYYASYERSFEHVSKELIRLEQTLVVRREQQSNLKNKFLTWGVPMVIIAFAWAAWVRQQPAGTYNSQEHFVRVLPVFLVPATEWMLYIALRWVLLWVEARDKARKNSLQAKLKKMVNELKDSTRYQKTNSLLQKYDPDFQPPTPAPTYMTPGPARGRLRSLQSAPNSPSTPVMQGLRAGPIGSPVPPSTVKGRSGNAWLSALDHLANVTIGSDPVLTSAVREAKQQAEKLREQLHSAEMHAHKLKQENAELRARLGEEQIPSEHHPPAQSMSRLNGHGDEIAAEGPSQQPVSALRDQQHQHQPGVQQRQEQLSEAQLAENDRAAASAMPDAAPEECSNDSRSSHEPVEDAYELLPKQLSPQSQSHVHSTDRELQQPALHPNAHAGSG